MAPGLVAACELLLAICGIKFPDQGLNTAPLLHWEQRVLATGPEGSSTGPPVPIILNKLLEIYRIYSDEVTLGGLLGSFGSGAGYQRNQPCD